MKSLFIVLSFILSTHAFAQKMSAGSGHSGGGNITEADLRYYIARIDNYLQSDEGKKTFPEIDTVAFHSLAEKISPVVQKGELRDANGTVRDCMSYADAVKPYFICNSDALPDKTLDNQPSFYRIVFHEMLVQLGVEKVLSKDIPSEYKISYRITENVHLETYKEWVPGKKSFLRLNMAEVGLVCNDRIAYLSSKHTLFFIWRPNGDYAVVKQTFPRLQELYGKQQEQLTTISGYHWWNTRTTFAKIFSKKLKNTVIARGNSKSLIDTTTRSSSRWLSHDDGKVSFAIDTMAHIEEMPQFTDGGFTEVLFRIKLGTPFGNYTEFKNLTCVAVDWGVYQDVPLRDIFTQKDQKVFKKQLIPNRLPIPEELRKKP